MARLGILSDALTLSLSRQRGIKADLTGTSCHLSEGEVFERQDGSSVQRVKTWVGGKYIRAGGECLLPGE